MSHPGGLRECCGVLGIHGLPRAARTVVAGLHALQHRGQEGAGVAAVDAEGVLRSHRGLGLVGEVFRDGVADRLPGEVAIGHVRYGTAGGHGPENVQPLVVRYRDGFVAIAHNGNLTNAEPLRRALEARGSIFSTSSDTEVVLHLLATSELRTFVSRLVDALGRVEGAWSLLVLTPRHLVAARDPHGFRPLVVGRVGEAIAFASETCAFEFLGGEVHREVAPGEMVIVDEVGVTSLHPFPRRPARACVFEHIYFSRPDSRFAGHPVYPARVALGRRLAARHPAPCDLVVPVPDSGTAAAIGYAEGLRRPLRFGLIRSHYVGRTFIQPEQRDRDLGVRLKLAPVPEVVSDRRVAVVDDSLVRGTTARQIVALLREAGAREVHLRIAAPPVTGPCHYGIDTPDREEMIAARLDTAGTCAAVGADSLGYLGLEDLHAVLGPPASGFCDACFSGDYPLLPLRDEAEGQLPLFGGPGG